MATARADIPSFLRGEPGPERPREAEDRLNLFVYHPLAARLARLLRPIGISPNAVSVLGGLIVVAAGVAYVWLPWPQSFIIGFALHLLWHVFDGADGDLARLTGRASPIGEMVDGACDYTSHIILYIMLAAMLDGQIGGWAWLLATAAGASHMVQANHAESQRRAYLWWAYGIPWLKHAKAAGDEVFRARNGFTLVYGWLTRVYLFAADVTSPTTARLDAVIEAAAGDPRRSALVRRLVRRASRRALFLQKVVGPNPRTIILGASMAFGTPLWFFLAEAVLLNLLLVLSVRHHNAVGRRLAEKLG